MRPLAHTEARQLLDRRHMSAGEMQRLLERYGRHRRARRRLKRVVRWAARLLVGARIAKGVTRATILRRDTVLKFPRFEQGLDLFLRGWLANRVEVTKWRGALHLDRTDLPFHHKTYRLLAPVRSTWLWGLVIVMDRCDPITEGEYLVFDADVKLEEYAYYFSDLHHKNFGRYEGRIVCLDYGE